MVAEDKGGFGGKWEDGYIVIRSSGAHATPWPLAESILASRLVSEADLILPDGPLTISPFTRGRVRRGKFSGEMERVPYGVEAGSIAAILEEGGSSMLIVADRSGAESTETRDNPAGEPRADLRFESSNVQAAPLRTCTADKLYRLFALMRSAQIAGALRASLDLTVGYARERQQFGKPLASFQAVQQQLAVLAEETAAAAASSAAAFRAADRSDARFEIAAAKLRCNRAAGVAAGIAHQVHGAMGFTAEYSLSRFTRRLWAWRSEFGNDRYWATEIGAFMAARGAEGFWPALVDGAT